MLQLQRAHYRSLDPIQHLRLKVSLWRVAGPLGETGTSPAAAATTQSSENEGEAASDQTFDEGHQSVVNINPGTPEEEPIIIPDPVLPEVGHEDPIVLEVGWQQKVMSREEVRDIIDSVDGDVNLLKTEAAPPLMNLTPLQRRRREMASSILRRGESGSALYTYVDVDKFDDGMGIGITTSVGHDRTSDDALESMGQRQHSSMYIVTDIGTKQETLDLEVNVDRIRRRELEQEASSSESTSGQQRNNLSSMFSWLPFGRSRNEDVRKENKRELERQRGRRQVLLVSIRAYPNGSIDIRPAFSKKEQTGKATFRADGSNTAQQSHQGTPRQSTSKLTSDDIIARATEEMQIQRYRFAFNLCGSIIRRKTN